MSVQSVEQLPLSVMRDLWLDSEATHGCPQCSGTIEYEDYPSSTVFCRRCPWIVDATVCWDSTLGAAQERERTLVKALWEVRGYWNGLANERALVDACEHNIETAEAALRAVGALEGTDGK